MAVLGAPWVPSFEMEKRGGARALYLVVGSISVRCLIHATPSLMCAGVAGGIGALEEDGLYVSAGEEQHTDLAPRDLGSCVPFNVVS